MMKLAYFVKRRVPGKWLEASAAGQIGTSHKEPKSRCLVNKRVRRDWAYYAEVIFPFDKMMVANDIPGKCRIYLLCSW